MPLPITIPNTFANATATIPLSQLDNNFATVVTAVNSIGNGAFSLANVQVTGGTIANVTLDNVSVDVETLSNVTITNLTVDGNVTLTNATVQPGMVISGSSSGDALRITQTGAGNALLVEDSTNPDATPFVIDAGGTVVSGYTTSVVNAGSAVAPRVQVHGSGGGSATAAVTSWAAGVNVGPALLLSRSEGSTVGTQTIVDSGDQLGRLSYAGSDGTAFIEAARIEAAVDGTPGTNDMPGRLVFSTTADGASSPTERMRIWNQGSIGIGTTGDASIGLRVGKTITGSTSSVQIQALGAIQSDVTANGSYYTTSASTQATSFTLTNLNHFSAAQGTFGLGSTVTNQFGFSVASSLTGATNNYGFYSNIASGTGRWNFYANGTANNYFAGNVLFGTTTARAFDSSAATITPSLQNEGIDANGSSFSLMRNTASNAGPVLFLGKSRSGALGGVTVVQSGDQFGQIIFEGTDGTNLIEGASIRAEVDGTPGTNDMPGRLVFSTTADGASTPTERMRIDSSGNVGIGDTSPSYKLDVTGDINVTGDFLKNGIAFAGLTGGQTGSAPLYGARAWVNFNGTGTVAIRASGNVSSITDNGTGDYTVNFTTAMPDAGYCVAGVAASSTTKADLCGFASTTPYTTTTARILTSAGGGPTAQVDPENVSIAIFR